MWFKLFRELGLGRRVSATRSAFQSGRATERATGRLNQPRLFGVGWRQCKFRIHTARMRKSARGGALLLSSSRCGPSVGEGSAKGCGRRSTFATDAERYGGVQTHAPSRCSRRLASTSQPQLKARARERTIQRHHTAGGNVAVFRSSALSVTTLRYGGP